MQEMQEMRFGPWIRKIPWSRKWQPSPVYLPGKFHGQRGNPGVLWSMRLQRVRHEGTHTHTHTHTHTRQGVGRKESKSNTKDSHQITREENKRRRKGENELQKNKQEATIWQ